MTIPPPCRLCDAPTVPTLRDRPDQEYGISVQLDYWHCTKCGLVFADPIPSELVPSFYTAYSTHERSDPHQRNKIWKIVEALTPPVDGYGSFSSLNLPHNARILDFGCGAGAFLLDLHQAGFTALAGCDFDPKVAATALPDLPFFSGIDALGDEMFDVITMNHVIEHVEDVPQTLARLRAHLRPGGTIYIRTPNAASVLANWFGRNWRGWETPRHLNVLTPQAMRIAVERAGGDLVTMLTSNDMRAGMLMGSISIMLASAPTPAKNIAGIAALIPTAWMLKAKRAMTPLSGEEIIAIIR